MAEHHDAAAEAARRDLAPSHALVRGGAGDADDLGNLGDGERPPIVEGETAGGLPARDRGGAHSRRLGSGTPWSAPCLARPALPVGR